MKLRSQPPSQKMILFSALLECLLVFTFGTWAQADFSSKKWKSETTMHCIWFYEETALPKKAIFSKSIVVVLGIARRKFCFQIEFLILPNFLPTFNGFQRGLEVSFSMLVCELSFFKKVLFFSAFPQASFFLLISAQASVIVVLNFFPIGFQLSQVAEFWPKNRDRPKLEPATFRVAVTSSTDCAIVAWGSMCSFKI